VLGEVEGGRVPIRGRDARERSRDFRDEVVVRNGMGTVERWGTGSAIGRRGGR
jgi:hypothetical protein